MVICQKLTDILFLVYPEIFKSCSEPQGHINPNTLERTEEKTGEILPSINPLVLKSAPLFTIIAQIHLTKLFPQPHDIKLHL